MAAASEWSNRRIGASHDPRAAPAGRSPADAILAAGRPEDLRGSRETIQPAGRPAEKPVAVSLFYTGLVQYRVSHAQLVAVDEALARRT